MRKDLVAANHLDSKEYNRKPSECDMNIASKQTELEIAGCSGLEAN